MKNPCCIMPESIANYFRITPEVKDALKSNAPVVSLESTIIASGMPYPANIETALECERIIRENGAIPATIAVLNNKICIGLYPEEIEGLGHETARVYKLSRRDIPIALVKGFSGATTVSATMFCANKAGISVFATGGIGGVHLGGETSLDISADLEELSKTKVAVVCAGAKAILDLGLTLEVLETLGVPVIGYQTKIFPAFYCKKSPFFTDFVAETPEEVASIIHAKWSLGLDGGLLIANPPREDEAMDENDVEKLVKESVEKAHIKGIRGKALTPFLLSEIAKESNQQSLNANIALVKNNARLAAQIACAVTKQSSGRL